MLFLLARLLAHTVLAMSRVASAKSKAAEAAAPSSSVIQLAGLTLHELNRRRDLLDSLQRKERSLRDVVSEGENLNK